MEITIELLAAYAAGNVSESERNAVRQYLTANPDEMETVMMMMDDDYDLNFDDEKDLGNSTMSESDESYSDICYSAAAFAPRAVPMNNIVDSPEKADKESFSQRLDDLLSEIDALDS